MKREIRARDREKLAQEIAGLTGLSIKELKDRWRTLYGAEAHQRISRELLTRAIAYRIQELALGGLKPSTRRLLERVAESASSRQRRASGAGSKDAERDRADSGVAGSQPSGHCC